MIRNKPASSAASCPGHGCRKTLAWRAVSVRRGSMTMKRVPRAIASRICATGCCEGKLNVESDTSGLVPTNINTSAHKNGSRPAAQPPIRSKVTHLADWSIVIVEKNEFDPNAANQAGNIVLAVWLL